MTVSPRPSGGTVVCRGAGLGLGTGALSGAAVWLALGGPLDAGTLLLAPIAAAVGAVVGLVVGTVCGTIALGRIRSGAAATRTSVGGGMAGALGVLWLPLLLGALSGRVLLVGLVGTVAAAALGAVLTPRLTGESPPRSRRH